MVGATGAVGETVLAILDERKFPVGELVALAGTTRPDSSLGEIADREESCRLRFRRRRHCVFFGRRIGFTPARRAYPQPAPP
jgi:aspartate-semialdehyde dehydrogenase